MFKRLLPEFLKYAVVGFSGIFVNLFFLFFFTEIIKIYYLVSEIIAFIIATFSNYVLNKIWTFKENINDNFISKGGKFFIVSGLALLVNIFFLFFFTEIIKIYYLLSQVLASAFTLITNYSGNKIWTFRKKLS